MLFILIFYQVKQIKTLIMKKYTIEKTDFKTEKKDIFNNRVSASYKIIATMIPSRDSNEKHKRATLRDTYSIIGKNDHTRSIGYFITTRHEINFDDENYVLLIDNDFNIDEVEDIKKIFIECIKLKNKKTITLNNQDYIWVNNTRNMSQTL